jgi:hypothetical protein
MGGRCKRHEALYGVRRANMEPAAQFTPFRYVFRIQGKKLSYSNSLIEQTEGIPA